MTNQSRSSTLKCSIFLTKILTTASFMNVFIYLFFKKVLAQRGFFKDPPFVNYLKYLQYWKEPKYAKFLK